MSKYKMMRKLLDNNNGVVTTSLMVEHNISKTYFLQFVKEQGLIEYSKGIYYSDDYWRDDLYLLQLRFPKIVYSYETALYLWGMIDSEPLSYDVTVPTGYNYTNLKNEVIKVHSINMSLYSSDIESVFSNFGHPVRLYSRERCLCDVLKSRKKLEGRTLSEAFSSYLKSDKTNTRKLLSIAKELKIDKELQIYMEAYHQ